MLIVNVCVERKGGTTTTLKDDLILLEEHSEENFSQFYSRVVEELKIDPGEHFPWQGLAAAGIGVWPDIHTDDQRLLFERGSRDRGVAIVQRGLAHIGYSARVTGVMDAETGLIIQALQRRYRPRKIDGNVDIETMEIIKALTENIKLNGTV